MLTIKAYPAPSPRHGLGLFAGRAIRAGDTVWRFSPGLDRVMSRDRFLHLCSGLDEEALSHVLSSSYKRNNRFYYLADNTRFINHDEQDYNLLLVEDRREIARRDIQAGEELLENYFLTYDPDDFFNFEVRDVSMQDYLTRSLSRPDRHADGQHLPG